jgi:hypothetical protein
VPVSQGDGAALAAVHWYRYGAVVARYGVVPCLALHAPRYSRRSYPPAGISPLRGKDPWQPLQGPGGS